jgi:hypothetical protein
MSWADSTWYFHNLKFDGHFIIDWLLRKGEYIYVNGHDKLNPGEFSALISDMGKFYSIKICFKNGVVVEIRDSLKKLPFSVKRVAQSFQLEEAKGEIDYDAYRAPDHKLTPEEIDYLRKDVIIIARAMAEVLGEGMNKLTVGSDALSEYKKLVTSKWFMQMFPVLGDVVDQDIRRAYRGGFCSGANRFMRRRLKRKGLVLDVNSLYPYVMKSRVLPYGEPKFVEGEVTPTEDYPCTIFSVTFTAKIKPEHIACIQIKGMAMYGETEYLTELEEPTTLMVTNVDWELYKEHYDIDVIAYGGGWAFHGRRGMFDKYINKWSEIKANAKGGKRELAKLHLNSLYGKFASNPNVTGKHPYLSEKDNAVHYTTGELETRDPVYTAVGVFITSYGRDITIRAAQANYDVFAYADTDSLHLLTDVLPEGIEVDPNKLGAWKLEYYFDEAMYIRAKANLGEYENRIAGLPEPISSKLTFSDITDGNILHGKLIPKSVPGGIVLQDIPFKLKV